MKPAQKVHLQFFSFHRYACPSEIDRVSQDSNIDKFTPKCNRPEDTATKEKSCEASAQRRIIGIDVLTLHVT